MIFIWLYIFWGVFISFYFNKNLRKKIPFECGFLPFKVSRIPFSIRFFFLLILFVIFDLEISLFLQLPFQVKDYFLKNRVLFLFFFLILTFCLLEE
ncbi:UNVERIFIED_CONTAM: hypothetical protein GTU68_029997 [Idotea baltica]|nr:hypothetical protein [Idotea baltica]